MNAETANRSPRTDSLLPEDKARSDIYRLLAAFLAAPPGPELLNLVQGIEAGESPLAGVWGELSEAARTANPHRLEDEYYALFIGLGRGELVPYASWYLTGFLMERPLGLLRDDLALLGIERNASVHEPEDHISAMCEVMLMLITDGSGFETESRFFETHMAPWCERFCSDLSVAESAVFYRNLGRFGITFFDLERRYFSIETRITPEREEL